MDGQGEQEMVQVVKASDGRDYKVAVSQSGEFSHCLLDPANPDEGEWRPGPPPEWTPDMLREVFKGVEAQVLKKDSR